MRRAGDEAIRSEGDVRAAYDRYGGELFGFALNALDDRHLAEDVVQETFVRAWRAGRRFDPARASLRTWLFGIARNLVIDAHRRRSTRPAPTETPPDQRTDDPFDRLLLSIQLDEALRRLSDDHREILQAVHIEGRTCAEYAAAQGISASTARSRLYYGIRALRLALEENGGLPR
ncbi:sigma-70 family RNA polymerase sigma factor [Amycolatopsis jejuensis]|uniref:sigma-70 family RNA polymerase sigma factor n=1 Tax=Amycolatopsis jejuensis TaxID=330084 RepID=UPI000A7724C2|nr:sigma-70 family RNA polymerase sigma factor [Amycolatopsis jejuensis]